MMRSALYYPHTTVQNVELIKTALLLWDRLEYIVPWPHFNAHHRNPGAERAMEMIGAPHFPDDEEKEETHRRLKEFLSRKLPPQFYLGQDWRHSHHSEYEMYSQKLLHKSWELLQEAQMSGDLLPNSDYRLTALGGLTVMSILADCCAGTTRSRVTDRGEAYATVASFLGNDSYGPKLRRAGAHAQLVPISLEVIDTHELDLSALMRLREREEAEAGNTLRDLRHRYVDGLETYVAALANEKTTKADAKELQLQFANDMKRDLKDLRSELGFARNDALLSKEVLVATLTTVGTAASWLFGTPVNLEGVITASGAPVAIGGLLAAGNKYLKERSSIMKRHPMAYLYETKGSLVPR